MIQGDVGALLVQGSAMGVSGAGGIYIFRWFMTFLAGRYDRREERLNAGTEKLFARMESRLDDYSLRLERAERALDECKEQHRKSESEVARLSALLQGYGDARQKIAVENAAGRANGNGSNH